MNQLIGLTKHMVQVFIAIAAQNIPSTDVAEFVIGICINFWRRVAYIVTPP